MKTPKIGFRLVQELAADGFDVAVTCRVLDVSRSGYYEWRGRGPSQRDLADAYLANEIRDIHVASRATYGAPRVALELRLGRGVRVAGKRVARLMRILGIVGVCAARKRRHRPAPAVHDDLVQRRFVADGPDRLWCTDVTEHPTGEGKVYCAAVLDVFSRRIVGWSIADHMRSELVVDALQMARWNRQPSPERSCTQTGAASTRVGSSATGCVRPGCWGSMGRVASSVDNTMMESFWSTMQRELLDRQRWATRADLASAIFEWIEGFYNPIRRHTSIGGLAPIEFEALHNRGCAAA